MFDLKSYLLLNKNVIDRILNEIFTKYSPSSRLADAMRYSLMAGGKRLRPILCIAASEAVGGQKEDVFGPACAIELIHTYSLIHDDLPAMDNDDFRRGNPANHIAFDEATAILSGDALLTLAFQVLSSGELSPSLSDRKRVEIIRIITRAAGYEGMVEGQMRDIASEGNLLTLDELKKMQKLKTGALIDASVWAGAFVGNGTRKQIQHLKIYSQNIGLAFQVVDDILDVEGDPSVLGKPVGTDSARNKNTFPSILGVDASKRFAEKLVNKALQALESFDIRSDPLRLIATYIIERQK